MNKLGLVLTLSLGLALSPLCAVESTYKKNVQNSSLSQADKEFLFASNASHLNVVALSDTEMNLTQGEAIDPLTLTILVGAGTGVGIATYEATKDALNSIGKGVKRIKKWFR